ncbi:hypothetical protein CF386_06600 [Paraphotobacterium marinum]|uniref:Uncharacterized protein n=2 Tax=Paraphotobacterium marinum TaxID=1755811 RepID=A0A220VEB7_9GAMM|nr:FUSC family membrane protein [Paraphotobacterium marinum]ASK78689.1 hypothetical protein CF386_06600 [Paraphotobacterium marinum]
MQIFSKINLSKMYLGINVLITLSIIISYCYYSNSLNYLSPLFLGVICAANTETYNDILFNIKHTIVSLILFLSTSCVTFFVYKYHTFLLFWLFILPLLFINLSSLIQNYSQSFNTAILFNIFLLYLLSNNKYSILLIFIPLCGAIIFFTISTLWKIVFKQQFIKINLYHLYIELSKLYALKSMFFAENLMDIRTLNKKFIQQNISVINLLNQMKYSLYHSHQNPFFSKKSKQYFSQLYIISQELHEKINASHIKYTEQTDKILIKSIKKIISNQSILLKLIANKISYNNITNIESDVLVSTDKQLSNLRDLNSIQIKYLKKNLMKINFKLKSILDGKTKKFDERISDALVKEYKLQFRDIKNFFWFKNKTQDNNDKFALRLAFSLSTGYLFIIFAFVSKPEFWILMTIYFICQPSYSNSKSLILQRIFGTILGLITSFLLINISDTIYFQCIYLIISGVSFFIFKNYRYYLATASITIFVFLSLNLSDFISLKTFELRLIDTLIGAFIVWICTRYLFQNWQKNNVSQLIKECKQNNFRYLNQVLTRFMHDVSYKNISYRLIRREAFNSNLKLNYSLKNILQEPNSSKECKEIENFSYNNQIVLSLISSLGSHRFNQKFYRYKNQLKQFYFYNEQLTKNLKESDKKYIFNKIDAVIENILLQAKEENQSDLIFITLQIKQIEELMRLH